MLLTNELAHYVQKVQILKNKIPTLIHGLAHYIQKVQILLKKNYLL